MEKRALIIIIAIIIVILLAILAYYVFFQKPAGQDQPQGSGKVPNNQQGTGVNPGVDKDGKKIDLLLWFADNDTTNTISYDLRNVPEDYALDFYMDSLNEDVASF